MVEGTCTFPKQQIAYCAAMWSGVRSSVSLAAVFAPCSSKVFNTCKSIKWHFRPAANIKSNRLYGYPSSRRERAKLVSKIVWSPVWRQIYTIRICNQVDKYAVCLSWHDYSVEFSRCTYWLLCSWFGVRLMMTRRHFIIAWDHIHKGRLINVGMEE